MAKEVKTTKTSLGTINSIEGRRESSSNGMGSKYQEKLMARNSQNDENLKVDRDYIEYGIMTPSGSVPRGSWSPDYWTVHAQLALLDPEANYKIVSRRTKILVSEWQEPTELLSAEESI